jgi:hypothetical protein
MAQNPAPPAPTVARASTSYHVLRLDPDSKPPTFQLAALNITAHNAEQAIRTHADKAGAGARGTYVAVPSRSWRPVTVSVETQTVLKLEAE